MIQHMNLVFGAEGLTVGEGAFLMACCNHTDAKGYVIASMRQIRDEAHLGESAAKSNKKKLIARGLLACAERYHPKNGARIADLYRVNLEALKQMQRKHSDYGPTVVEELTFAAAQENPSSDPGSESDPGGVGSRPTPPSDSDRGGSDPAGGGSDSDPASPSDSDPHFPPSSNPSSLSPPAAAADTAPRTRAGSGTQERENSAARRKNRTTKATARRAEKAAVPPPRPSASSSTTGPDGRSSPGWQIALRLRDAYRQVHGTAPLAAVLGQVAVAADEAIAAGDDPAWLAEQVVPFMVRRKYRDLGLARTHRECPAPPRRQEAAPRPPVADPCPQHPHKERAACIPCLSGDDADLDAVTPVARVDAVRAPAAAGRVPDTAALLAGVGRRLGDAPPPGASGRGLGQ